MPDLLIVLTLAAAQADPSEEMVFTRPLQDIPGIQINYYDVNGQDIKAVNRAMRERGKGSAGTDWNVAVSLEKRTDGAACTITGAKVRFNATATLPRLTGVPSDDSLPMAWKLYIAGLQDDLAAKLWHAHDRIGRIEQAYAGKPCDQGTRDGEAAIATLKAEFAALSSRGALATK